MLQRPGITGPILGTTRVGHLDDAAAAVDLRLSPQDVALLEEPYRPKRVLGMSPRRTGDQGTVRICH